MRIRYRAVREAKIEELHRKIKAYHHYEMHNSVGDQAWAALQSIMPGYLSKKVDVLADDVVKQV